MIEPVSMMSLGVGALGYAPGVGNGRGSGQAKSAGRPDAAASPDAYLESDPSAADAGVYSARQVLRSEESRSRSPEEEEQVRELQKRDQEVRQHEQSHMAMLGAYAMGGASYAYQVGPDGRAYAVGGSVTVDMSPEANDAATASKAVRIRMAAGGVDSPSAADMSVSAQASRMSFQATA